LAGVEKHTPVYAISIVAEILDVHPRTLRIYEECGLVRPARTSGNNRLYSRADLEILIRVRYLTQIKGVNLAGVKIILSMEEILGPVITKEAITGPSGSKD
jgi:MerR family transcriptional regulator/heat shock protein HspR